MRASCRIGRTARVVGLGLLVGRRAHQNQVTVGRVLDDDSFGFHPAGDRWGCFGCAEDWLVAGVLFLDVGICVGPDPWAAFFGHDHLAADLHAIHFLGGLVGRDVEPGNAQSRGPRSGHRLY